MGSYSIDRGAVTAFEVTEGRRAREEIGQAIYEDSQRLVPVDTGFLKASGFVESDDEITRIGYTADYAHYVEFGTSKMAAEPYLRPAALKRR